MTPSFSPEFVKTDTGLLSKAKGRIAVFVTPDGKMSPLAKEMDAATQGILTRMIDAGGVEKMKAGNVKSLAWPAHIAVEAMDIVCLPVDPSDVEARKAGAALGKLAADKDVLVLAGAQQGVEAIALGLMLRAYAFETRKSDSPKSRGQLSIMVDDPKSYENSASTLQAVVDGVFMTRDLVSEPANHLTTEDFAKRISAMSKLGLKIHVLDEPEMKKLGMGALLCVGQGSASPSKIVVMEWKGGAKKDAPLALVGKGVVFDTGGISLKPSAGMEDMTMDMGGAGVVVGVMRTLAQRKAKANVVGVVGLVENMPSGNATRPGDVVTSMKGDTIEVINTDAEGRLVLADALWFTQETYKPAAVIDLATLTGAVIIGLGHTNAGVFSNDDGLCENFLASAKAEGEGAWRMPIDDAYAELLKSNIADVKNVGGRPAGSITAAKFLQRFIQDDMPWIHLDIAGVASLKTDSDFAPKGATGWGVMALNRLVADHYEKG